MTPQEVPVSQSPSLADAPYVKTFATVVELCHNGRHVTAPISQLIEVMRIYDAGHNPKIVHQYLALHDVLTKIETWLDGVRNEPDRTRFEQRWNDLQDEAAELRVLILRAVKHEA